MAPWVHETRSAGGGTLTLTITGPAALQPGQFAARLAPLLGGVGLTTAGYLVRVSQDAYHEEPMRSRFEPVTQVGPGLAVFAGTSNADPILPFLEYDVRGHWMPWGPGTAFARWAAKVGVRHVYLAAKAYASHAHPGRHLMPLVLQQAAAVFTQDLILAVQEAASA